MTGPHLSVHPICPIFLDPTILTSRVQETEGMAAKREEDASMQSGKLDEELGRMSLIADSITPGCLLLCNESFAATNEREGSEIARQVIRGLRQAGVRVVFVTHLSDLAHSLWSQRGDTDLFLRAERLKDGTRTFRLPQGEPQATSYGADIYRRIFGVSLPGQLP